MSDGDYKITSRTHINHWDADTQKAVPGWNLRVTWNATGTSLEVFVPDSAYTPEKVDAAIREAGALDDQIEKLGGSRGATS